MIEFIGISVGYLLIFISSRENLPERQSRAFLVSGYSSPSSNTSNSPWGYTKSIGGS